MFRELVEGGEGGERDWTGEKVNSVSYWTTVDLHGVMRAKLNLPYRYLCREFSMLY